MSARKQDRGKKRSAKAKPVAKARPRPAAAAGAGPRLSLRRLVSWAVALLIWAGLGGLGVVAWYAYDLPDVNRLGAV